MPRFLPYSVSSPTVLVADDNTEMVEFLRTYLSRQGMRVLTAYSGPQCLEIARQWAVDVIVLDVVMPGMDGIETCVALKALPVTREVPVLLLTAKADKATRLAGIRAGICEFLTKPIRGKVLLECIRTQLKVRQWEQRLDELSHAVFPDELQV